MPKFLSKYFWDIDFNRFTKDKYPYFVIERILEFGDESAIRWLKENFNETQIKQALFRKRGFSQKSANYWALIFDIPKEKILCLQKSYQKLKKIYWPY
ncbi:MAG: hypothetical protein WBC21_01400 [Minisyncoccales bacterium]